MVYRKKRKTICTRCKKMKTLARFNDVDFGWGNFKKSDWCKVCSRKMDREREKANKAQSEAWAKMRRDAGTMMPIPLIGRSVELRNGKEVEISPGILRTGVGLIY